jgi:hypothetical protein
MKKLYAFIALTLATGAARAQTHGHLAFEMGIPIKEFKEQTDKLGAGARGSVYFPFQRGVPVFLGVGLGYQLFGSHRQEIHEVLQVKLGNTVIDEIPIDLLVQTNNNFFNAFVSVRYKAPLDYVQPYIEARGGLNNFYTRTKVLDNTEDRIFTSQEDNVITSKTQSNSTTYHFGLEGGFIVRLGGLGIHLGAAYLMGGKAKYYDQSQISQWTVEFKGSGGSYDPDNLSSENVDLVETDAAPKKSLTDMVLVNAGITFGVGTKKKTKKPVPGR